ncbi:predicted protein [Uncinocarpus reesii 1704]|uniref:Uncharacterized protein n=1 Tax=Uncinocarpus reesii (strain UAMH 1704) TaxID=336963 RepID=C4K088_UNCRE|nr:uncharacterized protein UREG_07902 [Uncinocarpus reesii 1704]EEP83037.1 predicted protein [Uncinocarpus reesii 1704]
MGKQAYDPLARFDQTVDLSDEDNEVVLCEVLPNTKRKYARTLAIFDHFVKHHPKAAVPPDIRTFKGFLRVVANSIPGRLDASKDKRPTVETMEGFRRDFETAWARERKYVFPTEVSTTMKEWIRTKLKEEVPLCTEEMDKSAFSPNDLVVTMVQLWCKDYHEYRGKYSDRSRVQLSFALLLYCFTSARTGEVHESTARKHNSTSASACYKHFRLTFQAVDGEAMLVLYYLREHVKNGWKMRRWELPVHAFYEVYSEDTNLLLNPLIYFLPLACSDGALRDYQSLGQLLDDLESGLPEGQHVLELPFKKDVCDLPLFRPFNELDRERSTGRARGADSFGKMFAALGHRAGFICNITARACRRWALMEADKHYSEAARMKFASQASSHVFGKSYAHPISEVDGQATYLGIARRESHIKNGRAMTMHHHPQLWRSLPAKLEFEFESREDIIQLNGKIENLALQIPANDAEQRQIQSERQSLYNQKNRLYMEALRHQQKAQPTGLLESGNPQPKTDVDKHTFFHYARRVMPERDLLADALLKETNPRNTSAIISGLICTDASGSVKWP